MKPTPLLSLFVIAALTAHAEIDPVALQRERSTLERGFQREEQKIDQAQEQAMIKVRTQERDLRAKTEQQNGPVGVDVATYMLSSGTKGVDFDKIAQARFATDEINNRVNNKLTPEAEEPFQEQRDALNRRRTLELAKFDTRLLGDAEGADKMRDLAIKQAEANDHWQEKLDALNREEQRALHKLDFEQTTKINELESKIFAAQQKQAFEAQKKVQEDSKNGKQPDMAAYAQLISAPSPEVTALTSQRDDLKNRLQTSREELTADYNVKRTDLQNQHEDELAKLQQ